MLPVIWLVGVMLPVIWLIRVMLPVIWLIWVMLPVIGVLVVFVMSVIPVILVIFWAGMWGNACSRGGVAGPIVAACLVQHAVGSASALNADGVGDVIAEALEGSPHVLAPKGGIHLPGEATVDIDSSGFAV